LACGYCNIPVPYMYLLKRVINVQSGYMYLRNQRQKAYMFALYVPVVASPPA